MMTDNLILFLVLLATHVFTAVLWYRHGKFKGMIEGLDRAKEIFYETMQEVKKFQLEENGKESV